MSPNSLTSATAFTLFSIGLLARSCPSIKTKSEKSGMLSGSEEKKSCQSARTSGVTLPLAPLPSLAIEAISPSTITIRRAAKKGIAWHKPKMEAGLASCVLSEVMFAS